MTISDDYYMTILVISIELVLFLILLVLNVGTFRE